MDLVKVLEWEKYPWLRHAFSTRLGGVSEVYGGKSLNLGRTNEDDPALVTQNRQLLIRAVAHSESEETGFTIMPLRQIHSTRIHVMRQNDSSSQQLETPVLLEGDGLLTDIQGVMLAIQTADCVPVIVIDPEKKAIAVFHAGWRGTVAAIVEAGVAKMAEEFQSRPSDLKAAMGPSIGPCCYTVGNEVRSAFVARFPYADQLFQNDQLDLWEANRQQILHAGVPASQITVIGECTGCKRNETGERKYFSHRIDRGMTGRMMSIVGIIGAS